MILEITIILLSIIVLGAKLYVQDWMSVLTFLFVLILCHYVFKTDNYISLGLAGIIVEIELDIVPDYDIQQCIYENLPFNTIKKSDYKTAFSSSFCSFLASKFP